MDVYTRRRARLRALTRTVRESIPACRLAALDGPEIGTCGIVGEDSAAASPAMEAFGLLARADGRPRIERIEGVTMFADPVLPLPGLIVVGGGHVALGLVPVAQAAGFAVTVLEERPEFARADRFPGAAVACVDPVAALARLEPGPSDFIVIATRSHESDLSALRAALRWPAAYVGMIGSRRKAATLRQRLLDEGEVPLEVLERVRAPIGLEIGAETPAEIAVAIVAELIAVRRGSVAGVPGGDPETLAVWKALAAALEQDQPCALATVIRVRGSTPRSEGAHMLIFPNGQLLGTVGGGAREAEIVRLAQECLRERQTVIHHAGYTEEQDALCGGVADVLIEPLP